MKILLATQNKHKIEEISAMLPSHISIIVPNQSLDIVEGDTSYIENAVLKAKTWSELYPDCHILADDSGLEVPSINHAPGVISAEYAGKDATHQDHIDKLLKTLGDSPDRNAFFVSYLLLLTPTKEIFCSRGECRGRIALTQKGINGFGYDPVFLPEAYNFEVSLAELSSEQKNAISHRHKALLGLRDYLSYIGSAK